MAKVFTLILTALSSAASWFLSNPTVNIPFILGSAFLLANSFFSTYFISPFVQFIGNTYGEYDSIIGHFISEVFNIEYGFLNNIIYSASLDILCQCVVNTIYFTVGIVIQIFVGIAILIVSIFAMMAAQYAVKILAQTFGRIGN